MRSPPPEDDLKPALDADWRSFRARLVSGERASGLEGEDRGPAADNPPPVAIGDKWAHPLHEPEKGCLLIATGKLDGVHIFERAVILMLSTGPEGPTGVILNLPSLMSIKETRSTALDAAGTFAGRPLFFGGPVEAALFLVSPGGEVEKGGALEEVMKGLYYGREASVGCAAEMVKRKAAGVADFRFFDGCCRWEAEQLRQEIRAGYWTVAACSRSVIGLASLDGHGLWDEVPRLMGPTKVW